MSDSKQFMDMYGVIEAVQAERPWGNLLDAGTGLRSANWINSLKTERWTAVSADAEFISECKSSLHGKTRKRDQFIVGNWADPDLLKGESYDTILVDYVVGAIEGYAPYFQYDFFPRLHRHLRGTIYVLGTDPYSIETPQSREEELLNSLCRLRDGCALIAGVQPYREYPAEWVLTQLKSLGLMITFGKRFPKIVSTHWIKGQFRDINRLIGFIKERDLATALSRQSDKLQNEIIECTADDRPVHFG